MLVNYQNECWKKFLPVLGLVVCFILSDRALAVGQNTRAAEEKKRLSADQSEGQKLYDDGRLRFDYGMWANYRFTNYSEDDNDKTTLDSIDAVHETDLRYWFLATLKPPAQADYANEHSFYLRIKDLYLNAFPEPTLGGYDHDGPHLDYAYLTLDLRPYIIETGRRYFKVGRGLAYGDVHDGFQINYLRPGWNLGSFVSHTQEHEDNIDASVPGFDKGSDRYFFGVGAGYAKIKNHQLYSYFLAQRDFSDQDPLSSQDFTYDSEYFGLGSIGRLGSKVNYYVEVIKQNGESRVFGNDQVEDIHAWGLDSGIERTFKLKIEPVLSLQYAFGSGDRDRLSVTDTDFGNVNGDDENFLYFGYIDTGLALAPRLSNLHMVRLGAKAKPLKMIDRFANLQLSFNYFLFRKHRAAGGISDFEASETSKAIGQEIDVITDWQVLSDLNVAFEYGHFMPGDAFAASANDSEDYFSLSLTVNF